MKGCFLQGDAKCKHTVICWPQNRAHGRTVRHASACSMVQDRTKFTNLPYYGEKVKRCWRKGAIKSNSSDLISEWFPWKSSDREMARQLVLVSHWLFYIREGPQKIQKRVCVIQWYFKKVLVYSPFSISSHTVQYKQYKHLPSLCPWISQVCRKWQMLTCHS